MANSNDQFFSRRQWLRWASISSLGAGLLAATNAAALVIYHFMYGKKQTVACPMCTAWIDSFNGVAHHLAQSVDLAIVAAADTATLRAHARKRGWDKLRLLSAGDFQIRSRQRRRAGTSGLDDFGFHARQ